MSNKELNEMIDWCKKKLENRPLDLTGKRREGYKEAMLQVMSYLHSKKYGGRQTIKVKKNLSNCVDCDECPHRSEDCLCDISNNDDDCPLLNSKGGASDDR